MITKPTAIKALLCATLFSAFIITGCGSDAEKTGSTTEAATTATPASTEMSATTETPASTDAEAATTKPVGTPN